MLEFWFLPQISTFKKLLIATGILLLSIVLYLRFPIAPVTVLMFLATGLLFVICRFIKVQFTQHQPLGLLARLLTWIPLAALFAVIFSQQQQRDLLLFGIQGVGFMALGIFLFSPQYLFLPARDSSSNSESK